MPLSETQTLLARLFTDAALRREFLDAPVDVAMRGGLDEAEARTLAQIDRAELEAFARSLTGKRALDLRKAMPLTARALGERFGPIVEEAIEASGRRVSDATALSRRLDALSAVDASYGYVADIARLEGVFVEATRPGVWIRRFRYDVEAIIGALRSESPVDPAPCKIVGIWLRAPGARLRWGLFRLQARR